MTYEPKTDHSDYHDLWALLDKTQSTTKQVKVDKKILVDLLRDHSTMYSELNPIEAYKVK